MAKSPPPKERNASDFVALSFVAEMTKFGEKVTLDSETKLSDQRL